MRRYTCSGVDGISLLLSYGSSDRPSPALSRLGGLSLNNKICVAATALVVASLAITTTVIGIKSSGAAEDATMEPSPNFLAKGRQRLANAYSRQTVVSISPGCRHGIHQIRRSTIAAARD